MSNTVTISKDAEDLDLGDLHEMLGMALTYHQGGFDKIKLDTGHIIQILELAIKNFKQEE